MRAGETAPKLARETAAIADVGPRKILGRRGNVKHSHRRRRNARSGPLRSGRCARKSAYCRRFHGTSSRRPPPGSTRWSAASSRCERGDSRFGSDTEAEVALGENFPLVSLKGGARPIALGFGSQVYARFSLSDPKTSLISHDWVVGLNATAALGRWDMTVELYHESSHLGDEYGDRFKVSRLDWTREVGAVWAALQCRRLAFLRRRELRADRRARTSPAGARARAWTGGDGHWAGCWTGRSARSAGIYTEATGATNWRVSTSAKLGLALPSGSGHEVGIALIAHDGLSTQRQFFRAESRYMGVEVRFDL